MICSPEHILQARTLFMSFVAGPIHIFVTRISARYARFILAPAEGFSFGPSALTRSFIATHRPIHSLYSCTHFIYNHTHSFDYHTYSPHSPTHSLHSQTPYIHSMYFYALPYGYPYVPICTHMYPYVPICTPMYPYAPICTPMYPM